MEAKAAGYLVCVLPGGILVLNYHLREEVGWRLQVLQDRMDILNYQTEEEEGWLVQVSQDRIEIQMPCFGPYAIRLPLLYYNQRQVQLLLR